MKIRFKDGTEIENTGGALIMMNRAWQEYDSDDPKAARLARTRVAAIAAMVTFSALVDLLGEDRAAECMAVVDRTNDLLGEVAE